MYCGTYIPYRDRFLITKANSLDRSSPSFSCHEVPLTEYIRYIPGTGVSLDEVDSYLAASPLEACFEITRHCNYRCKICIANATIKPTVSMSLQNFANTLCALPASVQRITLTGGEPTLHKDILKIISLCHETGKHVVVSSNGFLCHRVCEIAHAVKPHPITISLHGLRNVHDWFVGRRGAFNKVIESIRAASAITAIHVFSTATRETLTDLANLNNFLSSLRVEEHRINLVRPRGRLLCKPVSFDIVEQVVKDFNGAVPCSIKRRGQHFLFINCQNMLEERNGGLY